MANAIPIRVPGTGGSTLEYVLPANMMQFVQSVNAVIDNSGGTVTKPVLTVLDSSNEVIADVEQGRSIPAGGAGRATWALGLDDEVEDGPIPTKTGVYFNASQSIPPTGAEFAWTFSAGAPLLDLSNTIFPRIKDAGLYSLTARTFYQDPDDPGKFYVARLHTNADVFADDSSNNGPLITSRALSDVGNTVVAHIPGNSVVTLLVEHNSAVARRFRMVVYVVKIGA